MLTPCPYRCPRARTACASCGPMLRYMASGTPQDAIDAGGSLLATMLDALQMMESGRINGAAVLLRRPLRLAGLVQPTPFDDEGDVA